MRYVAQRATTGEWITRDLTLGEGERVRELSSGGSMSFTVSPELRQEFHTDGRKVLDDWGTIIYACDEYSGQIRQAGIIAPPQEHDADGQRITCVGFAGYPQGLIRTSTYSAANNAAGHETCPPNPLTPGFHAAHIQIDPLRAFRDQWAWMQAEPNSDLGVTVVGDRLTSPVRIGNNEEPYRLEWFEAPDLGAAMDTLASDTPFDYAEEHEWADAAKSAVTHRVRIGYPRLGRERTDLSFVQGVNIVDVVPANTSDIYANDVIAIGNGEGSTTVWSRATVNDGRLRRTRVLTDKTVTDSKVLDKRTRETLLRVSPTLDVATVTIREHRHAPISALSIGDDITVQFTLPSLGEDVALKVRVLSIGEADEAPGLAVLGVQRSSAFVYNPQESLS